MVKISRMSRIVHKEKLRRELDTQMKPFTGVVWQDLNSTQGTVPRREFLSNPFRGPPEIKIGKDGLVQFKHSGENLLEGLAPTPQTAIALLAKPIAKLSKGKTSVTKSVTTIQKRVPLTRAEDTAIGVLFDRLQEKLRSEELLRVYSADDVDIYLSNMYGRLQDNIELLTLSQPRHAKRKRRKVASRNRE